MRILLTTEAFAGGVRRHVLELCGGIRQAGHEPILAVSCERDDHAQEALIPWSANQAASSVPLCRKAPYHAQSDRLDGEKAVVLLGSLPRSRFVPPSEPSGFI